MLKCISFGGSGAVVSCSSPCNTHIVLQKGLSLISYLALQDVPYVMGQKTENHTYPGTVQFSFAPIVAGHMLIRSE